MRRRKEGLRPDTASIHNRPQWDKRPSTADLPMGPRKPRSTSLSVAHEAGYVAFRRHTALPLDDCL
jgi:hypothetical protein